MVTLKHSPKLVLIVAILVAVLVIAVYAVTVLFTQTAPGPAITKPGSGTIISDCSTLTMPSSIVATTQYQGGVWTGTCNGGAAVNVTTAGTLVVGTGYTANSEAGYTAIYLANWTGPPPGCNQQMTRIGPFTTPSISLSKGQYYYCIDFYLNAYGPNTPSAFPSLTITWESP